MVDVDMISKMILDLPLHGMADIKRPHVPTVHIKNMQHLDCSVAAY